MGAIENITKINSVEPNSKDDLTDLEIKTLYESNANTNAFTDADNTAVNAIVTTNPAYTAPTLGNGWVNYGGSFDTAGYMKDMSGTVFLKGLIKNGTINTVAFTLPAGYRPSRRIIRAVIDGANAMGRLDITNTGQVIPNAGSTAYFSIDISFPAEQ